MRNTLASRLGEEMCREPLLKPVHEEMPLLQASLPKLLICCHVLLLEEFTASHIRTSQTKIPDFSSQFKSMDTGLDLFILHMEIHYCVCRNTCNMFVHACKPEGNLSSQISQWFEYYQLVVVSLLASPRNLSPPHSHQCLELQVYSVTPKCFHMESGELRSFCLQGNHFTD